MSIEKISAALVAAGITWLDVSDDPLGGFSLRHDTGDNTSKENYDDALDYSSDIDAALKPLFYSVSIDYADHDTVIYRALINNSLMVAACDHSKWERGEITTRGNCDVCGNYACHYLKITKE